MWDTTEGGLPGGFGRGGGGRGGDFGRGGGGRLGGILGGAAGDGQGAANPAQQDPARQAALKEQQRRTRQTEVNRLLAALLVTLPEAAAWVGTAVTPKDEKADVLEFKTADDTITRLFLDIESHVPLMMTYSGPAPRGGGGQGRQGQGGNRRGGGDGAAGAPGGAAAAPTPPAPAAAAGGTAPQGGARAGGPGQPITIEMYLGDYKVDGGVKIPGTSRAKSTGKSRKNSGLRASNSTPTSKRILSFSPNNETHSSCCPRAVSHGASLCAERQLGATASGRGRSDWRRYSGRDHSVTRPVRHTPDRHVGRTRLVTIPDLRSGPPSCTSNSRLPADGPAAHAATRRQ